jgi:ATP synthase protein I
MRRGPGGPSPTSPASGGPSPVIPALVVAVLSVVIASFFKGRSGFWGALLAGFTVIVFFLIHLVVSRISKEMDPMVTMALAMFSYFAKVLLLGGFLFLVTKLTTRASVDRPSFGAAAVAIIIVWVVGEVRAFLKLKLHLPLPPR